MIASALEDIRLCPDDVVHILVPECNLDVIRKCLELIYTGYVKLSNSSDLEKSFDIAMKLLKVK